MEKSFNALLVDDSSESFRFLSSALPNVNIEWINRPETIDRNFPLDSFHFYVVDYYMPVQNGEETLKLLHKFDLLKKPKFVFTCDSSENVRMKVLNYELTDIIDKSMKPEEVYLRIMAGLQNLGFFSIGNLLVERNFDRLSIEGKSISLTENERKILQFIVKNRECELKVHNLLSHIWNKKVSLQTFNTHFSNLNKKLETWDYTILRQKNTGRIKVVPWKA